MNELSEVLRASLENRGEKIEMYSTACAKWKQKFFTCFSCPSELGCRKLADLLILSLADAMQTKVVDNIFKADTIEELLTAEQECNIFRHKNII